MPGMSSESPVVPGIIDSVNSGFINLGWHPLSNINFICLKVYHSVSYQNDGNNPIKKSDSQRTFTKYLKSCIQNYLTIANVEICFNLHLCIYADCPSSFRGVAKKILGGGSQRYAENHDHLKLIGFIYHHPQLNISYPYCII